MKKGEADRLIVIGEGELRDAFEAQVRDLGIDRWVKMPGESECLEAYYETADLFVMASRQRGAANRPDRSARFWLARRLDRLPVGPAPDPSTAAGFGTLVPMDDPAALAKAMEDGLAGPVDQAALTSRANDFAPDAISRRLLGAVANSTLA